MTSSWPLFAGAAVAVSALGFVGAFVAGQNVRRILSLNMASSGVFLLLVATARRSEPPDPVSHALALTGIVVSVSATALALTLAKRLGEPPGPERRDLPREDGS